MFALAPSKSDQSGLRYWTRNRYKAHVNGVRWTNRAFSDAPDSIHQLRGQIRNRPILLTEDQKAVIRRETGFSPFLEVKFVPVARGSARSQTRKK